MMLDINGFKSINDKFGHITGDIALQNVAQALELVVKDMPIKLYVNRFGGDEFVIFGKDVSTEDINKLKYSINRSLEHINLSENNLYKLSVSIGVYSGLCSSLKDVESVMKEADKLMYIDKKRIKEGK